MAASVDTETAEAELEFDHAQNAIVEAFAAMDRAAGWLAVLTTRDLDRPSIREVQKMQGYVHAAIRALSGGRR